MASYTRYLAATAGAVNEFAVQLFDVPPLAAAKRAIRSSSEIRYSPVMPAFLTLGKPLPPAPKHLKSVSLIFANLPYKTLGIIKRQLNEDDRARVYFTEGLASIVLLNFSSEQAQKVRKFAGDCPFEHWPLKGGNLHVRDILLKFSKPKSASEKS